MGKDVSYIVLLGIFFLTLFSLAELLYRFFNVKTEHTRKLVHFITGILTLLFPVLLTSHWSVLLLCATFFIILTLSMKFKFLPSINNIDRISNGSLSYPVAVYVCFYVYTFYDNYIFFYLPILILAICDPLAALFGKNYPKGKFTFFKEQKTLVGSGAFFIGAFALSFILLTNLTALDTAHILLLSTILSILTCLAEAITQKGYDNLTVPFIALMVLTSGNFYLRF